MKTLYPRIKTNREDFIQVGDGHCLYVEESGSLNGLPVVYLHGGPGAGSDSSYRRYFDPQKYRIILFDQRGSGRSEPHASIKNNTTQALIEDLEIIRNQLNIQQWVVMGGSWGSTLALAYAQAHPESVSGIILRGVFLGRQQDLQWLYADGTRKIFPDYWQDFIQLIPENERDDLLQAYYQRLAGADELARMSAAKAWATWEAKTATLEPNPNKVSDYTAPHIALPMAMISAHYFVNHCFLEENQLIDNMHKIAHIPGIIVHGRYDMLCAIENAWTLKNHWNNCELRIIRDAGHSASEAGIIDGLIRATKKMHQDLTHDRTDSTSN